MSNCLECLHPISGKCVEIEEKLSFEHTGKLVEIITNLDKRVKELEELLTKVIDNKWAGTHEYVTDYIQDIINKLDVKETPKEIKYNISSPILGEGDKSLLQVLTLILKSVEAQQKNSATTNSSLYLNV